VHLVGFTIQIYYDVRPYECQTQLCMSPFATNLCKFVTSVMHTYTTCMKCVCVHTHALNAAMYSRVKLKILFFN